MFLNFVNVQYMEDLKTPNYNGFFHCNKFPYQFICIQVDSWERWNSFRIMCEHHTQLSVALDVL